MKGVSIGAGLAALACLALTGCVSIDEDLLKDPGRFSGQLMVFWDREDEFIYYPAPDDPLKYTLPRAVAEKLGTESLTPGIIFTDGGSIPRPVRGLVGFSPWGYGPTYILHDWIFATHHCIDRLEELDPRDREQAEFVRKIDFPLSADLLATSIAALVAQEKVPKRTFAPKAIYGAVDSVVALNIWNKPPADSCSPVPADKVAAIERALYGKKTLRVGEAPEPGAPVLVYQQGF